VEIRVDARSSTLDEARKLGIDIGDIVAIDPQFLNFSRTDSSARANVSRVRSHVGFAPNAEKYGHRARSPSYSIVQMGLDAALSRQFLIGGINGGNFLGRERYKFRWHATCNHLVGMIIKDKLVVMPS
jgi:hypothetical protein